MASKADGTIIINTKIDTDGIKEGIENTKKELSFGDVIKGSAIGSAVASMVESIVSNVAEIGQAFIESAATVKAESSQFVQTFGDMQGAAHEAISGIADDSGILETRLNTLGSQIYAFARSSGGETAESLEIMEGALKAAADGAAYYDRSLEDTTESLQSLLKGNYENDAALGLSVTETTRNAKAMELFGQKFNDLSEIQKQKTLLQMVLDAQKLSGAMGQAAREADGWENVQGNLNESVRQFQAAAGQPFLNQLVPIVQSLTTTITNLTQNTDWLSFEEGLNSLVNSFKENGIKGLIDTALPMLLGFSESLRQNAGVLVDSGIELILDFAKGFMDGLPTMLKTIPQIVSNIAGIINDNAPKLLIAAGQLVLTLLKGLWDAIPDLLAAIPDIIIAIVDVFTAFNWLNLGKNIMKFLKDGFTSMIGTLKTTATGIKDNIVNVIKQIPGNLKTIASNGITGMINAIKGLFGSVKSAASGIITNIVNGVKNLPSKLVNFAKDAINQMKNKFTNGGWKNLGKAVVDGIIAGISSAANSLFKSLKNLASNALNAAKKALGIKSPSRKFRDIIGKMIPPGITAGLEDKFPDTLKALKKQTQKLLSTAGNMIPDVLEYSTPIMASGTVIPANKDFSNYNPVNNPVGFDMESFKSMFAELLENLKPEGNGDLVITIDGDEVFRVIRKKNNEYYEMTGRNAFA